MDEVVASSSRAGPDISTQNYSADLTNLLIRASMIREHREKNFNLTFTSLFLAFLANDDSISKWFRSFIKRIGIEDLRIMKDYEIDPEKWDQIVKSPLNAERLKLEPSRNSRIMLQNAEKFHDEIVHDEIGVMGPIDVRHLMAVFIYEPGDRLEYLEKWGFDDGKRESWSNSYINEILKNFPNELSFWKGKHRMIFRKGALVEGLSARIACDKWTLDDTLGYRAYARAIYRFMTRPETEPPLTISIQAPWGGGKTSLMRMIRHYFDPKAQDKIADSKKLSLRSFLGEILWPNSNLVDEFPFDSGTEKSRNYLTVWFDAWKFQNTNQVWAGMADAIIRQVSERLPLERRERFLLRLNLSRVDADKVRYQFYERILNTIWQKGFLLLWISVIAIIGFLLKTIGPLSVQPLALIGPIGVGVTYLLHQIWSAAKTVKMEPASIGLNDYLQVPDYRSEAGFIYAVDDDMHRLFKHLPENRLVIFIDDLDRCLPATVASVMEGINLFLSEELNCMFIIGMDTEMVAAALDEAHAGVVSRLPEDSSTPVGWRFMDKFVQLPFIIPPIDCDGRKSYLDALLFTKKKTISDDRTVKKVKEVQEAIDKLRELQDKAKIEELEKLVDKGIEEFSNDENKELRDQINEFAQDFSPNPRELKRFINTFKFYYSIWWAWQAQGKCYEISLEQLIRWVWLTLKWPEVVRWIQHGGGRQGISKDVSTKDTQNSLSNRIRLLEQIGKDANSMNTWVNNAKELANLDSGKTRWLNDDGLRQFFKNECNKLKGQRLSDVAGKGLW